MLRNLPSRVPYHAADAPTMPQKLAMEKIQAKKVSKELVVTSVATSCPLAAMVRFALSIHNRRTRYPVR
jgi:hypothetical protein